jgi:hypothetical protein
MTTALQLLHPRDRITCERLSATLRAEHCVRRQQISRRPTVDRKRGGETFPACLRCAQGERVAAALGVALVQIRPRPVDAPEVQRVPKLRRRSEASRARLHERAREKRLQLAAALLARKEARPQCEVPGCTRKASPVHHDADALAYTHAGKCAVCRGSAVRRERARRGAA